MSKRKILIAWVLVIAYMGVILAFSSDPATVSGKKSGIIVEVIIPFLTKMGGLFNITTIDAGLIDHFVRKCAHIFNYFVLGLLSVQAWRLSLGRFKRTFLYSWLLCTAFSGLDEFYQTFIPGRSGQFTDVLIDNIGVLAAILLSVWITVMAGRRIENKQETI